MMDSIIKSVFIVLIFSPALLFAAQAEPVPIPEEPSTAPQLEFDGTLNSTLDFARAGSVNPRNTSAINFNDSAFLIGAAQRLYNEGAVGSFGFGMLTNENSTSGTSSPFFQHQLFADYQEQNFEVLIGRSDNPSAHLIDFPTLRGDDLITFLNPLDPFSNGINTEEHRYSNVASVTLNQDLRTFENFHVQHLIDSTGVNSNDELNSFGLTIERMGTVGMERLDTLQSVGIGYEYIAINNATTKGISQFYGGGVVNILPGVSHSLDFRFQDIASFGNDMKSFSTLTDSFQADSNAAAISLRYLDSPFGKPAHELALTLGYKNYFRILNAESGGFAVTAVRRLGQGFDLTFQYSGSLRNPLLSAVQSSSTPYEQIVQVGFSFNFNATLNQHIGARRTILNMEHKYIPD